MHKPVTCHICPRHCELREGQLGVCRARVARDGHMVADNYGHVTSLALDPMEKKPLLHFHPGSNILSVGSYGCNLRCPWCQNSSISYAFGSETPYQDLEPGKLVAIAQSQRRRGNIGIAYTYNEPLVGFEFVLDTARLIHDAGLVNVVVTNGMVCDGPLQRLVGYIDAFNIDLKTFDEGKYRSIGGDLDCVKHTIEVCAKTAHVEVTTLVIPGYNDSVEEIGSIAAWLSGIDPAIPLHLSRFFPRHEMTDRPATPIDTMRRLAAIASRHLGNVHIGNC